MAMVSRSSRSPGAGLADEAKVLSRASKPKANADVLGMIAMFCGAGLVVAVLLAIYGLDLSIGFF